MAARKAAVAEPEAAPYDMGLTSEDVTLPRMRVVGKLAKLVEADIAKAGDIAIGQNAEDEDSIIVPKPGGVRFYVLKMHANYACKFGGPQGQWEEGDPEMPPEAKRQYNYTLYVPDHDTLLPVLYTTSGTAAREGRKINGVLLKHIVSGAPYELCFEITTKTNTAGTNSWPGPVFNLAKPDPAEVEAAKAMHDSIVGSGRAQLEAGADAPGF